ncbi:hypothetical protein CLU79DRAFT_729163 [Phycomyces nitens]|nr:hypothetical protein CLU79DRAFT_729163 [Phycomyces nitens]
MISPEVPRLIQDTREAQKIRIDSLNTAARRFQEERVAVIPQNNEKEWEMKTKQVKYEALSNTVFQLAKMFEWSEEKTKKELDDKFHQIFN